MFTRTRKSAPVVATTRRDIDGTIVAVTFTDGAAFELKYGIWISESWLDGDSYATPAQQRAIAALPALRY